ncbi:MAG: hypothetical protein J7K14_01325 [Sulfurimonas sp.]|nr:hypothetical protein [Sulfurimonas sp.]
MISAFSILFLVALLSISLHRSIWLKPTALLALLVSAYFTFNGASVILTGFASNESIRLFELILEVVLFALVLHIEEDITITQTLFVGAASILLLQSVNILSFVISFEALSIISIVLVSYIQTKEQAEGAVKMFIAAALATGILFLGLMFYVIGGGDLLSAVESKNIFEVIGLSIMLAGVFYKLTIVPFHGWAADSYALVRHSHAAILTGIAKTVVALASFKIFAPFIMANIELYVPLLATLAVVTITLGNFLALFQKSIAKILSYSSIAHAGYMLLAFMAVKSEYAKDGILYMSIAYIFMQSAAFLVLDILRKNYNISTLEELKGFASQNRIVAFFFTIQLFSLAGIPLLAGFLGKAVVFYAGVDAGLWYVVLIALLNSALSVGYYAWIVKGIYFDAFSSKKIYIKIALPIFAQLILFVGTVYFGIFASTVFIG